MFNAVRVVMFETVKVALALAAVLTPVLLVAAVVNHFSGGSELVSLADRQLIYSFRF